VYASVGFEGLMAYDINAIINGTAGISFIDQFDGSSNDSDRVGDVPADWDRNTRVWNVRGDTAGFKTLTFRANGTVLNGSFFSRTDTEIDGLQVLSLISNGNSCTQNEHCSSSFCDVDGVGWSDDSWCFIPVSGLYDGQDSKCEVSANNSINIWCDEKRNEDLNTCDKTGVNYKEDSCSDVCGISDKSIFECGETGCSCSQSLCDGLTTGDNITTCSDGQTYFADKCTSTADGEDRTDNICRSSVFDSSCSASSECNGVNASSRNCDVSCVYSTSDVDKFFLKNEFGSVVAWFGDAGNVWINGTLTQNSTYTATVNDEFRFQNPSGGDVLIVDLTNGNLYLDGFLFENQSVLIPSEISDDLIVQNSTGHTVAYINQTGSMFLKGFLNEKIP